MFGSKIQRSPRAGPAFCLTLSESQALEGGTSYCDLQFMERILKEKLPRFCTDGTKNQWRLHFSRIATAKCTHTIKVALMVSYGMLVGIVANDFHHFDLSPQRKLVKSGDECVNHVTASKSLKSDKCLTVIAGN